jgi:acyl carrier protein
MKFPPKQKKATGRKDRPSLEQSMNDNEIYQQMINVLAEEFELEEERLVPEATLFDELGLDSLDAVDMIVAMEKAFGFKMRDEEAMRAVRTVDDLFRLLLKTRDQLQHA